MFCTMRVVEAKMLLKQSDTFYLVWGHDAITKGTAQE